MQRNGDIFAFDDPFNTYFAHGVPPPKRRFDGAQSLGHRLSVIVWATEGPTVQSVSRRKVPAHVPEHVSWVGWDVAQDVSNADIIESHEIDLAWAAAKAEADLAWEALASTSDVAVREKTAREERTKLGAQAQRAPEAAAASDVAATETVVVEELMKSQVAAGQHGEMAVSKGESQPVRETVAVQDPNSTADEAEQALEAAVASDAVAQEEPATPKGEITASDVAELEMTEAPPQPNSATPSADPVLDPATPSRTWPHPVPHAQPQHQEPPPSPATQPPSHGHPHTVKTVQQDETSTNTKDSALDVAIGETAVAREEPHESPFAAAKQSETATAKDARGDEVEVANASQAQKEARPRTLKSLWAAAFGSS